MNSVHSTSRNLDRLDAVANELLTLIEFREVKSLTWGFTDIRQDLDNELEDLIQKLPGPFYDVWSEFESQGYSTNDLTENLLERKLLFRSSNYYRSRFAETVRLLSLLRQRFSHEDWDTASTLVSDYRLSLKRRRYPKRDTTSEQLLEELASLGFDPQRIAAINALLQVDDRQPLRLAKFQTEAVKKVSKNLSTRGERGVVIGAGTGAGKTKAFYIPALAEVAVSLSNTRYTQALALYPRNELLKDQFVEAFSEARKLDSTLEQWHKRLVSIGAYYGDTPYNARWLLKSRSANDTGWTYSAAHSGWECPFVRCPNESCGRETLIWRESDVNDEAKATQKNVFGSYEILRCPDCGLVTKPGMIQLTRESMRINPPDILFTTTEMLNRNLANSSEHQLFGIRAPLPPRLLLLDEIHTYEGVHGAQVAYLLRRWRHGRGRIQKGGSCVVGLSATLAQAERFFAELTGIPEYAVDYLSPSHEDMVEEGAEYNIVLKGDPASTAALLSTSVQTTMLLGRMLDPVPKPSEPGISRNTIGHKTFAFTDNLDVINRWYHVADDAERRSRNAPLSQYRLPQTNWSKQERSARIKSGQVWYVSKEGLGHDLNSGLRLERTTSQDRGVSRTAQLVIATSTLEVGFNDPAVGAVIQHKAPRNFASFLQRKGRAGRVRSMRPWTVVVTSAFGRDRWAFQHSEQLFDPYLPPNHLPLENDYVRKIQASYALMDWLAIRFNRLDIRSILTNKKGSADNASLRNRVAKDLQQVLDGPLRDPLILHIASALSFNPTGPEMRSVLWQEPRSLLFDLIPTLIRQLRTNWFASGEGPGLDTPADAPIPEYVPASLFSDLNMPELEIEIPPVGWKAREGHEPTIETMPIQAGMREFAPGRASKRFTERDLNWVAYWLPINTPHTGDKALFEIVGSGITIASQPIQVIHSHGGSNLPIYKPLRIRLDILPKAIEPTSSGRLQWDVHYQVHEQAVSSDAKAANTSLGLRSGSPLTHFVSSIDYVLHDQRAWATVTRYASSAILLKKPKHRKAIPGSITFQYNGSDAAIGFSIESDAVRLRLRPFNPSVLRERDDWDGTYSLLAPMFFKDLCLKDSRIQDANVSAFDIDWLWQIEKAAITATAIASNSSLEAAAKRVDDSRISFVERTLRVIFQTQRTEAGEEVEEHSRRYEELLALEENLDIIRAIQEHRSVLWNDSHPELDEWLEQRNRASVGSAIFTTITRFVPNINTDDIICDVDGDVIWISETVPGGVGIISQVVRALYERPRQFDVAFLDTIQFCDRDHLASQLTRLSSLLKTPHRPVNQTFASIREGGDLTTVERLTRQLTSELENEGIATNHSLFVALHNKFLRPNSGADSDQLVSDLVELWQEEEKRLAAKIDLRTIAVAATQVDRISETLDRLMQRVGTSRGTENQKFNLLQSMLWEGCSDSCPECIQVGHLYTDSGHVSRHLLSAQMDVSFVQVRFGAPAWKLKLTDLLGKNLEARVACDQHQLAECSNAVLEALIEPIDLEYQLAHGSIQRIARDGVTWVIHIAIPDLIVQ